MTQPEHVPEVLPAPPAVGTQTRPVPGKPGAVPRSVPGRRPVALGLAALGVVILPVAGLLLGLSAMPGFFIGWVVAWNVVAAVCWLLDLRTPRRWVGWALLAALPQADLNAIFAAPRGLLGLLVLVIAPLLAHAGYRRFTTPGLDLAETDTEFPVPLRSAGGTMLIGRDRVVLARTVRAGGGHGRHALPLAELSLAQPGEVTDEARWPLPGGTGLRIRKGPALRLVAGPQQWLIPLADPVPLAAILRRRATAAWPQRTGPQDQASWHALRKWAVARNTTIRNGHKTQAYTAFRAPLGFIFALLGTMLLISAAGQAITDPGVWIVGSVASALGGYLLVAWLRVRRRMEFAELHQLPPGSPPWGDRRAEVAPVPEWQPWN